MSNLQKRGVNYSFKCSRYKSSYGDSITTYFFIHHTIINLDKRKISRKMSIRKLRPKAHKHRNQDMAENENNTSTNSSMATYEII